MPLDLLWYLLQGGCCGSSGSVLRRELTRRKSTRFTWMPLFPLLSICVGVNSGMWKLHIHRIDCSYRRHFFWEQRSQPLKRNKGTMVGREGLSTWGIETPMVEASGCGWKNWYSEHNTWWLQHFTLESHSRCHGSMQQTWSGLGQPGAGEQGLPIVCNRLSTGEGVAGGNELRLKRKY